LKGQNRNEEALKVKQQFETAWQYADYILKDPSGATASK
jgi:hypothetical protein